jgi:hypothetical protein
MVFPFSALFFLYSSERAPEIMPSSLQSPSTTKLAKKARGGREGRGGGGPPGPRRIGGSRVRGGQKDDLEEDESVGSI